MLPRSAVKKFLDRPFNDYRIYKRLSDRRMDALARRYRVPGTWWRKHKRHQKAMTLAGLREPRFAMWADTGCGKTFVSLVLAQLLHRDGVAKRFLVLVPHKPNKGEWQFEIEKHFPRLSYCLLPSQVAGKWASLEEDALLYIETYAGLYAMLCKKFRTDKGKIKLKWDPALVRELSRHIDGVILDQSTEVKRKGSLPFRICRQLCRNANAVFALSGTPHGRDPTDLWAQMNLVDNGETLGETLGLFRAVFFSSRNGFWGGKEHTFHKRKAGLLHDILANRSLRFTAQQADLPALVAIRKYAQLPEDANTYYQRAKAELMAAGSFREMRNAFLRMRQISSGFVGYYDDDRGVKAQYEFAENPKLELLLSIIETALSHKSIVFYEYTWSAFRIARELKRLGIGYQHLWSGTKDSGTTLRNWKERSAYPVMLLQNQFGIGLNMQVAQYGLFYESPCSPITRKECVRRYERQFSNHAKVFQYDLLTRGTVDEQILEFIREGNDLLANIIDGRKRLQ